MQGAGYAGQVVQRIGCVENRLGRGQVVQRTGCAEDGFCRQVV